MSADWPRVPLGEVLKLQRRWVKVEPTESYNEIGVRCFGNGIFHKDPISGQSLGDKRVLEIHPGDLVLNNVFAWEGAVALAGPGEAGKIGSHRFVTCTPDTKRCVAAYFRWFFVSEFGLEVLQKASPGSAGRNRTLNLDQFLASTVPLPPLAEQRRIVERVEAIAARIAEAKRLRDEANGEVGQLIAGLWAAALPSEADSCVGDFIKIQNGYAFQSEWFTDEGVRLARNVNVGHGALHWLEVARIPEAMAAPFERFVLSEGDILISLDRPLITSGVKVAKVRSADLPALLLQRVGRVQFRDGAVCPDYFFAWLRSPRFINAIDPGRSNGVPHISSKDIERLPFKPPPLPEQRRIVAHLDALQAKADALRTLQTETAAELDALLPSVLNRAFAGEL